MASLQTVGSRAIRRIATTPFVCTSCLLKLSADAGVGRVPKDYSRRRYNSSIFGFRPPVRQRQTFDRSARRTRFASNGVLASSTAINPPSTVPPALVKLHQRLQTLQDDASSYVDRARLQLAIRSLESSAPVVRVALLGLGPNGALAAGKLARLLLSDALGDEGAWEAQLRDGARDGRSLLLRNGDHEDFVQDSAVVTTLSIPSPFLQRHNVEILVTTLNANNKPNSHTDPGELEEAILVPSLTTPTSAGGRIGFVRYPVHKALIVAEGIAGAVEYGRFPETIADGKLINAALSVPLRKASGSASAENEVIGNVVDIELAEHALALFRASNTNGAQFSDEWQTSRMPAISEWIAGRHDSGEHRLRTAVTYLVDSILTSIMAAVRKAEIEQTAFITKATIQDTKRNEVLSAVSSWSADAHRDLQFNLNTALASRTWKRTAWFRLLWRIDDVSVSAADILRLNWLTDAEQSLAFLSGRIAECGLATPSELKESNMVDTNDVENANRTTKTPEPKTSNVERKADLLPTPAQLSRLQQQNDAGAFLNPPWPQTIRLSRLHLLHSSVPELHRKAQTLLVRALTTIGGTGALSAWLYVATAGTASYEASAIAALGVVWSLRRLQKRWSRERDAFAVTLHEDGRRVLADVESHLRKLAQDGGRVGASAEDLKSWHDARQALAWSRAALADVQ